MIERYCTKEMKDLWSEENKYSTWLEVELAALKSQSELGIVPQKICQEILQKANFDIKRINEIEETVKHDVIAFTTSVGEHIGELSSYFHYGLTSSDVVDTSWCILTSRALKLILNEGEKLLETAKKQAFKYKDTIMIGRTHGVHAEPYTLGLKFALFYDELKRDKKRLETALETISVGKLSGAVGTYAHLSPEVEKRTLRKLGVKPENISTQVVQRDRFAEVVFAIAITGATLEKFATEIRHLQKTEVREVEEPFSKGQKGSSAMPHKRNPVGCENITGLARLLRGYLIPAIENISLWHERDISHSSVERVIIPDSTTVLHYVLRRMERIIRDLFVYPENMKTNLEKTKGLLYSQKVLLALAQKGFSREEAYLLVQSSAMKVWNNEGSFEDLLYKEPKIRKVFSKKELHSLFEPKSFLKEVDTIFKRVFKDD
ncbi:MAG: adenylosuccinate lyase [Thermoanaerobaculaceae bacterium]|nr:adenylosuccinate lyase [Thermoanaerobaculaceae bacterium]